MKRLADCVGRNLLWVQRTPFSRESELLDGDELCARLSWSWGFNPAAEGETEDGRWRFRRRGAFNRTQEIYAGGEDEPLATCRFRWRNGTLRFRDGRELMWRHESLWRGIWRFETQGGAPLLHLRYRLAFFGNRAEVSLEPDLARGPDASVLVLFGWYLILRMRRRSHAS
jgi:hypothetical protein